MYMYSGFADQSILLYIHRMLEYPHVSNSFVLIKEFEDVYGRVFLLCMFVKAQYSNEHV